MSDISSSWVSYLSSVPTHCLDAEVERRRVEDELTYPRSPVIEPVLDTYMDTTACADRLWREYTKHGRLIVAVDFDETISPFHGGSTHEMVIALLRRCSALGFHLYLFTASNPTRWEAMKAYARERGIAVADGVNVNPILLPFGNWGKPYWNCLIDDRAGIKCAYDALLSVVERVEATTVKA